MASALPIVSFVPAVMQFQYRVEQLLSESMDYWMSVPELSWIGQLMPSQCFVCETKCGCTSFDLCDRCAEATYGIRLAQSTVNKSQLGIFATRDLPVNTRLPDFVGELLTQDQLTERYPLTTVGDCPMPFVYRMADGLSVDTSLKRGYMAHANNASPESSNIRLQKTMGGHAAMTTRPIAVGTELLLCWNGRFDKNQGWTPFVISNGNTYRCTWTTEELSDSLEDEEDVDMEESASMGSESDCAAVATSWIPQKEGDMEID